jgi:predicted enzyme related to lactoylglutathione lyase
LIGGVVKRWANAYSWVLTVIARLVAVALDTNEPNALGRFWASALGWDLEEPIGFGIELVPTDATSFRLTLRSGAHVKIGQNRIHFDLTTTTEDNKTATVAGLLAMGAAHIDIGQDPTDSHVVMADPEGNEFCVIAPENRFLASCPRLGAVNCDGSHALGRFWSEALGWPLVWDEGEETAIQALDGTGPKITWSGPPLMPRPARERFHFHVAPISGTSAQDCIDHLIVLGASPVNTDYACSGAISFTDVDGNPFCVVEG